MPSKSKDAVISELKKELEAMRLQDQATKSELSKVSMELKHKNTVVKDLQVMFSGVVQFHVGTRQRKKKHGKAGLINVADKATRDVLDRCSVLVSDFLWQVIKVMPHNWTEYSEDKRTTCFWLLTKLEDYIPKWWEKDSLWHIYLVPITIEVLAEKRSSKTHLLHQEFRSKYNVCQPEWTVTN